MIDDLVRDLRSMGYIPCVKAAVEIDRLKADNERLRAALQEIAVLPPVDGLDNFEINRRGQELRLNEQGREIARRALENKP